ncbi:hypothetical protein pipiens_007974 [Culex pipiens pipiens]|uniref:Uncharacterized protein n=2 Tax=Culex pipiens TaxID=7175 RepID=A0ABD1DJF5_CULPP
MAKRGAHEPRSDQPAKYTASGAAVGLESGRCPKPELTKTGSAAKKGTAEKAADADAKTKKTAVGAKKPTLVALELLLLRIRARPERRRLPRRSPTTKKVTATKGGQQERRQGRGQEADLNKTSPARPQSPPLSMEQQSLYNPGLCITAGGSGLANKMALLTENPPCSRPPRKPGRVQKAPCRNPPPHDVAKPETWNRLSTRIGKTANGACRISRTTSTSKQRAPTGGLAIGKHGQEPAGISKPVDDPRKGQGLVQCADQNFEV